MRRGTAFQRYFILTVIGILFVPYAVAAERLEIPEEQKQADVLDLVREIFKDEYASRSPEVRLFLARELFQQGKETKDPSTRYVLLKEAAASAVEAGEPDLAVRITVEMGRQFKINVQKEKYDTLKATTGKMRTKEQTAAVVRQFLDLSRDAVAKDDYEIAADSISCALRYTRKIRDKDLSGQVKEFADEVSRLKREYAKLDEDLKKLDEDPNDPDGNLAMGKFLCFIKGQRKAGLPCLAKGSDEGLKKCAEMELTNPEGSGQFVAAADAWIAASEASQSRDEAAIMKERGRMWYESALPGLKGLEKIRIEKILASLEPLSDLKVPKGAVLILTFDKGSIMKGKKGLCVRDFSGHRNHGSVVDASMVQGQAGEALRFGHDDRTAVIVDNSPSLQITGDMTISMWLCPDVLGDRRNPIDKSHRGEGTFTLEPNGSITYYYGIGRGKPPYQGIGSRKRISSKQWSHVVLVRDLEAMKLRWYMNGAESREENAKFRKAAISKNHIRIGRGYAGAYIGKIDEVAIWSRALSKKEIKSLYSLTKRGRSMAD